MIRSETAHDVLIKSFFEVMYSVWNSNFMHIPNFVEKKILGHVACVFRGVALTHSIAVLWHVTQAKSKPLCHYQHNNITADVVRCKPQQKMIIKK